MRKKELTAEERATFRTTVELLEGAGKGWNRTNIASVLGYTSPAPISTIMKKHDRGASREKYERLLQILENDEKPPTREDVKYNRTSRKESENVSEKEVDRFITLVEMMKERGITVEEIAHGIGYSAGGSLYQAMRRRKVTKRRFEDLKAFAESENVRARSHETGQLPPVVKGPESQNRATVDYFRVAGDYLLLARKELQKALDDGVRWVVRPGIERAVRIIEDLEGNLRLP